MAKHTSRCDHFQFAAFLVELTFAFPQYAMNVIIFVLLYANCNGVRGLSRILVRQIVQRASVGNTFTHASPVVRSLVECHVL